MTDARGGPSSADIFDRVDRVYQCAGTVGKGKPHLSRTGYTWGVSCPLSGWSPVPVREDWRAAAYAWCRSRQDWRAPRVERLRADLAEVLS